MIMIIMMMISTRAFLSCNKEPLRGHDSTQDLAASIEAEALIAKVHHHFHHLHHHHHCNQYDHHHNQYDHHCNQYDEIQISIIIIRLEVERKVEAVQEQELFLLIPSTISKCFIIL